MVEPRPLWIACERCGEPVWVGERGRMPRWCARCRVARWRERQDGADAVESDAEAAASLAGVLRGARRGLPVSASRASGPGGVPGYMTVHGRLRRLRGSALGQPCADCAAHAHEWSYDGGDLDALVDSRGRVYSLDLASYVPRCRSCHRQLDLRRRQRREVSA
jgi:hypothetical protein